jgi:hypothetical protein
MFANVVWRRDGTRNSATESERTIDIVCGGHKLKKKKRRERDETYGAQLGKERDEVRAASAFELLFEEIDVYKDVRHRIFVHHRRISVREEILFEKLRGG